MNRRNFFEYIAIVGGLLHLPSCKLFETSTNTNDQAQILRPKQKKNTQTMVLRVSNPIVSSWDYTSNNYLQSVNSDAVYELLCAGLKTISKEKTLNAAWKKLLAGYNNSQKIAIKPNLNNPFIGYKNVVMTSPQVIEAVVRSLIEAKIPPENITLFDLTAFEIPEISDITQKYKIKSVWGRVRFTFSDKIALKLNWGQDAPDFDTPIKLRRPVNLKNGTNLLCYIPKVLKNAQHLINLPVFKAHQFVIQSSALKNHFGTVRYSNKSQYPNFLHGKDIESHIVDINAHPEIAQKTRLVIADGIFGAPNFTRGANQRLPTKWKTFPDGETPNSLFFSADPIALESVLSDYIIEEQLKSGFKPFSDQYLRDAAQRGLGVYERRDKNGHYSKIDYIEIKS